MASNSPERPQTGPDVWMERAEPRLPRPPSTKRPRRPLHYRPGTAWVVLVVSITLLVLGVVFSQVIVLAVGLILAGTLGHLFDLRKAARYHPSHPSQHPPPRPHTTTASTKTASPQTGSPQTGSPKFASPKFASPKTASSRQRMKA